MGEPLPDFRGRWMRKYLKTRGTVTGGDAEGWPTLICLRASASRRRWLLVTLGLQPVLELGLTGRRSSAWHDSLTGTLSLFHIPGELAAH